MRYSERGRPQETGSKMERPGAPFSMSLAACRRPIVLAFELYYSAHFLQSGAHSFADSIAEGFFAHRASCGEFVARLALRSSRRLIGKVCSDDRRALVVVASI